MAVATIPLPQMSLEEAVTEYILVSGQLSRRLRAEANSRDLTWSQMVILTRLERGGPASIADLARAEALKPQTMGASLAYLEKEGLVQRSPHPTDARQILFSLTDDGRETRRKTTLGRRDWLMKSMKELDPADRDTLLSAINIIRRLANS